MALPGPRRLALHERLPSPTPQGDSELDGTGIETSINGRFKLTLHKKADLPAFAQVGGQACHVAAGVRRGLPHTAT